MTAASNPEREKAIEGICQRTGKTREQAVAFLDVLGSGLTKRGLADAKVLTEDETAERVRTFIGEPLSQRRRTIYCDECQLWLPCHKYDARYRAEEVLYLCDVCVLEVLPIVDKETSPVGELFAYPGATAPDPAVVEARRLTAQRAIAVCQIHFEHSLNFLGQRVGRATHASPWHPCSVGDAIHEGMADA